MIKNILILNLMPNKIITENHLKRVLNSDKFIINYTLLTTKTYNSKTTPEEYLKENYKYFDDIKENSYDGLIITGAPVENFEFEEVAYWDELTKIFEFAKTNVKSTIFICWGAQAALYYFFGIQKFALPQKLSGVYKQKIIYESKLLENIDKNNFEIPHSRYTSIKSEDILKEKEIKIVAESFETGVSIIESICGKYIFLTGHSEYDKETLKLEYERDLAKGISPEVPENYFKNDDISNEIIFNWNESGNKIFTNWVKNYL